MSNKKLTIANVILLFAFSTSILVSSATANITPETLANATVTVKQYGKDKAEALYCLTFHPAVGVNMEQVFARDEAIARSSWLANGGTAEQWSKLAGLFGQLAEVPADKCPQILDDLYTMRSSGRLLTLRSPFKEMSTRPGF